MFRSMVAAAILAGVPMLAQAQSASAPLVVSATVVSTCKVDVPHSAEPSLFSTLPVAVTCARRGAAARVRRPLVHAHGEMRDIVLIINF